MFASFGQTRPVGNPPVIDWGPIPTDFDHWLQVIYSRPGWHDWALYYAANPNIALEAFKAHLLMYQANEAVPGTVAEIIASLPTSLAQPLTPPPGSQVTPIPQPTSTTPSFLASFNLGSNWPILGILGIGIFVAMRGRRKGRKGRGRKARRNPCRRR